MSEIDVSKCKYYSNICKDKYGQNFYEYCHLYEDKCDKYPQCIYRDKQLQQLKVENEELRKDFKNVEKDRVWIKERCIDAGKELGKHSFAWDGKEKNLVIQAMQLNEMYEQLKAENEELKEKLEKIKEVINCDEYNKEHCIYCAEAHHCYTKQVLEIIESEN